MTDIKISHLLENFNGRNVRVFAESIDDGDGNVNERNGEKQKLLFEFGVENIEDLMLDTYKSSAATGNTESNNDYVSLENAVNDFNNMELSQREAIRDSVKKSIDTKLQTLSDDIANAVKKAKDDCKIYGIGGCISPNDKDCIESDLRLIHFGFSKQYSEIKKNLCNRIAQYDYRYKEKNGAYIRNEYTELLNSGATMFSSEVINVNEQEFIEELMQTGYHSNTTIKKLEDYQMKMAYAYLDMLDKLQTAADKIIEDIKANHNVTMQEINKVTAEGNLKHEVVTEPNLSCGQITRDKLTNVSEEDPQTYNEFVNTLLNSDKMDLKLKNTNDETGISSSNTDKKQSPVYDLQGKPVTGPLKKGVYIQNGKKFLVK